MQPRRAILLFAIVLGVAAIASTIARTPDRDEQPAPEGAVTTTGPRPTAEPGADPPRPTTIEFHATAEPQVRELAVGRPATVLVEVETPGEVEIPSLGLTEFAEPLTPAVFELLPTEAGSHPIVVRAAAPEAAPARAGRLEVVSDSPPKRSDRIAGERRDGR